MKSRPKSVYSAVVIDETTITMVELSRTCNIHAELLIEMVEHGLLEPIGKSPAQWKFNSDDLRRVQTALRLQRDLGVNLSGAALVLDLLDELQELRMKLSLLR